MNSSPSINVAALFLVFVSLAGSTVRADDKVGKVKLAETERSGNVSAVNAPTNPQAHFSRKWNESEGVIRVDFANPADRELRIDGVQVTTNLFVVSFPKAIKPNDSETFVFRYLARAGVNGDVDLVNLLTNDGIKTIEMRQDREKAFALDVANLEWVAGEPTVTKTATLTLLQPGVRPKSVRTFGEAKVKTELREIGDGKFTIEVTPASADRAQRFAIVVEMEPELRGSIPLIQGAIVTRP